MIGKISNFITTGMFLKLQERIEKSKEGDGYTFIVDNENLRNLLPTSQHVKEHLNIENTLNILIEVFQN